MSASMSMSSNRMRTDLNPRLRCLRWRRIRCAAGEDERVGGIFVIVLLDAALHLVYELPIGAVAPTGASRGAARPEHGPHTERTVPRCPSSPLARPSVPTMSEFLRRSGPRKVGTAVDFLAKSQGLSRRRSRVRAPSLPPLLSMSYWAPVKIRDTLRFSSTSYAAALMR